MDQSVTFTTASPGAAAQLIKRGAQRKHERMGQMTVEEQRAYQQKLYEALPLPGGVEILPVDCAGVPCEWIWKPESHSEKGLPYLHGGGWTMGNLVIARHGGGMLAEKTPYKVLAVEYRLAPEHPFPAGLTDCRLVYGWLLGQGYRAENIALFGDSAGGNLCLALLHLLLEEEADLPCCVGCASPVTDIRPGSAFRLDPPELSFAGWEGRRRSIVELYAQGQKQDSPLLSPVCGDLSAFPPVLIHAGGDEQLAVDNAAFAKAAAAQGCEAHCKIWREMFHDFTLVGPALRESRESLAELAAFYDLHLGRGASPRDPAEKAVYRLRRSGPDEGRYTALPRRG